MLSSPEPPAASPKNGSLFVNIGNSWPNVLLVVRACQHPLNSFADINFVIPSAATSTQDIPKTYVYLDSINKGSAMVDHLVDELKIPGLVGREVVCPFNATLSHEYCDAAMEKFHSGEICVLVCTDTAGMVCYFAQMFFHLIIY